MNSQKTGQKGEQIVVNILRNLGYRVTRNTKIQGSTDIEVERTYDKLLIQAKTTIFPNQAEVPTGEEIRTIKSRAAKTGRKAMLVEVVIDPVGNLVDINWMKL